MTPTEIMLFDNNDLHASIPATLLNPIKLTSLISFIFNYRQDLASGRATLFYANSLRGVLFNETVMIEREKRVNSHPGKCQLCHFLMVQVLERILEIIQEFKPFWVPQPPCKINIHVL